MEGIQTTSQVFSPPGKSLSIANVVVTWVISVTGICANGVVLAVLILARRHYGSHVNTLIANQSAIDLCACIFLLIGIGMFPGIVKYDLGLGNFGNDLMCYVFRSRVLTVVCRNAGNIGLLMINVESFWTLKCGDLTHGRYLVRKRFTNHFCFDAWIF